jgi:hypothetical protein
MLPRLAELSTDLEAYYREPINADCSRMIIYPYKHGAGFGSQVNEISGVLYMGSWCTPNQAICSARISTMKATGSYRQWWC